MTSKKKCVVVTCFSQHQPGFLDFSYRIQALAEQYELTIISQDVLTQTELQIAGAEYIAIGRFHGKLGWLKYLWLAARIIRKNQPDVAVLLHSSAAPIVMMVGNIPTCLYWNEHPTNLIHLPESKSLRYLITVALHHLIFMGARHADIVMPIGEEHRDELLKRGCQPSRVNMIYMGVDDCFAQVQKSSPTGDKLCLIYVGSISIPRGRDVMLEAMNIVAQQSIPVKLSMVGADAEQLQICQSYIDTHHLADYLEVHGRVPGAAIPAMLANADAGICLWEDRPWWRFNPPTKLFEYFVAGLPILASDIRTHTRYVVSGSNGIIFAYHAPALAEAIVALYQSKSQIDVMSESAKAAGLVHLWSQIKPVFLQAVKRVEKI
ncbi:glycosyltransferase [Methylobacillus pratensis]